VTELRRPRLDLEDCSFGSCTLSLDDFTHAIRHEPRTRLTLRWACVAGAVSLPLGVWLMTTPAFGWGLGSFVLGVACFAAYNFPEQAAARWFAKTPREARSVRYTLSAAGLIVVSDAAHQSHAWRSLEGFYEAPAVFLVWVSSRSFLIVPKRAFAPEQLPRIAARFESEVGAPPALPPFWSWLALAIVLALTCLALWNHLAPR
jgi:hypothetical protein